MKTSGRIAATLAAVATVGVLLAVTHRDSSNQSVASVERPPSTGVGSDMATSAERYGPVVAAVSSLEVLDAELIPLSELASGYLINLESSSSIPEHLLMRVHSRVLAEPLLNDRSKVPVEKTEGGEVRYLFPGTERLFGLVAEYFGPQLYVTIEAQGGTEELVATLARSFRENSDVKSGLAFDIPPEWRSTSEGPSPSAMGMFSLTDGRCSISIQSMIGGEFAATEALRTMNLYPVGSFQREQSQEIDAHVSLGTIGGTAVEVRTSVECGIRAMDVLRDARVATEHEWSGYEAVASRRRSQAITTTTLLPAP